MLKLLTAAALFLLTIPGPALAKRISVPLCPGGHFTAADLPLVPQGADSDAAALIIDGGLVRIGASCSATTVKLTRVRSGTLVRARWTSCDGLVGTVRLRAVITKDCATANGTLRSRRRTHHFVAHRQPECGNGIREGQEQCDGSVCCTTTCTRALDASCPGAPTCTSDGDCASNAEGLAFCARPPGRCEGHGICHTKDVVCTANVAPVCGCDGKTYSNTCEAIRNGVSVAAPGQCAAPQCGTIAGLPCKEGQVCELPPGECRVQDTEGRCVDAPGTCLGVFDPVCGCDGNTYVNDCYRLQAGVQKARDGECRCRDLYCSPGTKPIDTNGDVCPDECVRGCDDDCDCLRGPAVPAPQPCPEVCASDEACGRFRACENHLCVDQCGPVPIDTCASPPCASNDECPADAFCLARGGECGGAGICAPRPEACPTIYLPVCGCDGVTYGNECEAAGHGARVEHRGPCECRPPPCVFGRKPIDGDGDGCPETCAAPCDDACDCLRDPALEFTEPCPLACPNCGNFWTCEDHACVEHCGPHSSDVCECEPLACREFEKAVDSDGDGCPDTCVRPCVETCDCYRGPGADLAQQCPLDCATCGEFWQCEEGVCRERCGPIPPGNDQCHLPSECKSNDQCDPREYCAGPPARCDGVGVCVDRPEACTREVSPVCGCDGQTYSNGCMAAAAGTRVAARGACDCRDVPCPDGTKGVDTDADGCADQCRRPCETACDCGLSPNVFGRADICPLAALCPAPFCGDFWTCEDGLCIDHCGVIPQGQDVCQGIDPLAK